MEESFAQSAGRHLTDSCELMKKGRLDNAVYLAGYVVECAFKTLVQIYHDYNMAKAYGHNLVDLQGQAMERLRVLYPAADLRLPHSRTSGTILDIDHPVRRYARTGLWSSDEVRQAVERAHEIYEEIILGLILDGVIPSKEL